MRSIDIAEHFENFLLAAVAAILGIRGYLELTGYPKVGGDSLHIAHMLWGGLLMAVAAVMLFGFIGRHVRAVGAVIAGLGFGTFIDELGKFITHDNDYFYEPAVALIYLLLVLSYVAVHRLLKRRLTTAERRGNAAELLVEAVRGDLNRTESRRAMELLEGDRSRFAEVVRPLLAEARVGTDTPPTWLHRAKDRVSEAYGRVVRKQWFGPVVVGYFVLHSILSLARLLRDVPGAAPLVVALSAGLIGAPALWRFFEGRNLVLPGRVAVWTAVGVGATIGYLGIRTALSRIGLYDLGELVFTVVPSLLVVAGIIRFHRSRLLAYHYFHRALLVLIFITQFFAFYDRQFGALFGFAANLVVLTALRYMIHQEERLRSSGPARTEAR